MISRLGQDKEAAFVSSSVDFHEMVINFKVLWKHLVSTEKKKLKQFLKTRLFYGFVENFINCSQYPS